MVTFNGVGLAIEDDICCAQTAPGTIVVDGGRLQMAKLGEKLLDVAVGDTEVQVGHHQLGGTARSQDAASAR